MVVLLANPAPARETVIGWYHAEGEPTETVELPPGKQFWTEYNEKDLGKRKVSIGIGDGVEETARWKQPRGCNPGDYYVGTPPPPPADTPPPALPNTPGGPTLALLATGLVLAVGGYMLVWVTNWKRRKQQRI